MSHVVAVKVQIKNLDTLAKAAEDMGATLVRGQRTHRWFGKWMNDFDGESAAYRHGVKTADYGKCDHAITHPDCDYDIGVIDNHDGTYSLIADEWQAGNLVSVFGENMKLLTKRYSARRAMTRMKSMGFMVRETTDASGKAKLICTR